MGIPVDRQGSKMHISNVRMFVFAIVAVGGQVNLASAADYDVTYTGNWRNSDDIVSGWDWTLPAWIRPAVNSGIFNLNTSVPRDFPGNHLKQVNAKWSDLEPTDGQYDLSSIIDELNDDRYEGVMLNVRGLVVDIRDLNGDPIYESEISAPKWLSDGAPKTTEGEKNGFFVTNMNIYDPRVKAKYIRLIQEIGKSSIPGSPRLMGQIIHGVSSSRGEEWTGTQASRPEAVRAMEELINAWGIAYGGNAKKLAWLKEDPNRLFDAAVIEAGTGIRGGAIEKWLRNQYTPGNVRETGQVLDANGYLTVDENFWPISQGRHFQDQNEAYRSSSEAPPSTWPSNYRMANLRMLQMRRNIAWLESNSTLNPQMLNWMSLELGQSVRSAPDAWVVMMRTWARTSGEDREINNMARWLHQRDINGVSTIPTLNVKHGFNANANEQLPSNLWNADIARVGPSIGIAVNDQFLSGGPHSIAIKVTYLDSATETWSLVYKNSGGGFGVRTVKGNATGIVRTATFFLNDFAAPEKGFDFDFALESNNGITPFMFVRLVRLQEQGDSNVLLP
jgi:hypothetical protein